MERDELLKEIKNKLNAQKNNIEKYFSIYALCGITGKENIYSNIIANFLNPHWLHGQGDIFLKKFCELFDIKFANTEKTTVTREEVIPGRRPDIVIRNGSNLIVIENKTGTCDHEEQLQDYWNWMCDSSKNPDVKSKTLIYLTKKGEHPRCNLTIDVYNKAKNSGDNVSKYKSYGSTEAKFILLPYSEIRDWCACCAITPGIPVCVADAFKQYANFIDLWLKNGTDDSDIIALCANEDNLATVQEIFYSKGEGDGDQEALQWVNDNYAQIIKTYIASKFLGKEWKGNLLEIHSIGGSPFRITIQLANNKFRYGITQSNDYPKLFMDYNGGIKEIAMQAEYNYKDVRQGKNRHDCWWVFYCGDSEKKTRKDVDEIINKIQEIFEMHPLLKAFEGINASESEKI